MNRKYIPDLPTFMKLNKKQRIITVVAIVLFTVIGINYYYSFSFDPVGWVTYKKPSLEEVSDCIKERESERINKGIQNKKKLGEIQTSEEWLLQPEGDQKVCNPPQLDIISITEVPIRLRQRTIQDVLFAYFAIGIVTGLLLFLTKDIKRK